MARLQHRFSPRRIRLGNNGNKPLGGGEGDSTLFLVGRELCLFIALDAGKVPLKQRKAFAALAVRRAAPFPDPDFDAAWTPSGTAAIWYWSRARVEALAAGEPGRRRRFAAEAMYVGTPLAHGVELLRYPSGFEARAWKDSRLTASRCWPESPSSAQWAEFIRGAGQGARDATALPEARDATLSSTPWSRQATDNSALQFSGLDQHLPKAALWLAALVLLGVGAEIGFIARAQADIWRARAAATRLDAPLKRILDARDATDRAGEEIAGLLALQGLRPTTSLMAEVTRLMPGADWQVQRWNQPTPDTVEIGLIAPGSNPEQLVSAWEASPMFKSVTTELGDDNELVIKAVIVPASGAPEQAAP